MKETYTDSLLKVCGVGFTTYRGVSIEHVEGSFVVFNIRFDTLEQAKHEIDHSYEHLSKSINKLVKLFNK